MTVREMVAQAIGEASMCWSETPKGIFDSVKACHIIDRVVNEFIERDSNEHKEMRKMLFDFRFILEGSQAREGQTEEELTRREAAIERLWDLTGSGEGGTT